MRRWTLIAVAIAFMLLAAPAASAHDGPLRHDYRHAFYDC
jgi:hypothetical protein